MGRSGFPCSTVVDLPCHGYVDLDGRKGWGKGAAMLVSGAERETGLSEMNEMEDLKKRRQKFSHTHQRRPNLSSRSTTCSLGNPRWSSRKRKEDEKEGYKTESRERQRERDGVLTRTTSSRSFSICTSSSPPSSTSTGRRMLLENVGFGKRVRGGQHARKLSSRFEQPIRARTATTVTAVAAAIGDEEESRKAATEEGGARELPVTFG